MPRSPWNLLGIAALCAALASGASDAGAEWVDWILDADMAIEYTDNLNNSSFRADERGDVAWLPSLEGGRVFQLTDRTRISVSATFAGELYNRWDDLNATIVPGPEGRIVDPIISPDGQEVAFGGPEGRVQVVPLNGGLVRTLADSAACCMRCCVRASTWSITTRPLRPWRSAYCHLTAGAKGTRSSS